MYPAGYDRVEFLIKKTGQLPLNFEKNIKLIQLLRNKSKFTDFMNKTEDYLLSKSKYNIVIKNIPSHANYSENDMKTDVTHENLRATFNQFGLIDKLDIIHSHLYINFRLATSAIKTHKLVDNMQMGDSRLKSRCIIT